MAIRLDGRVALVTGAGQGLGRSHARALARHGARVVVNDLSADAAEAVAAEIREAGGEAIGHVADVTDAAAIEEMVAVATGRFGAVDLLVCNAGVLRDRSFAKMSLDDFRLVLDVHLMGAVHAIRAVWPQMVGRGYGRIVLTTSASGLFGNFGQSNYGAAKMALVGLMQTLAIEGERHGIRVNCLAPTAATEMTRGLMTDAMLERLSPEAVSPAVIALVAEDAPIRTILLAGAGHFAAGHVTMTQGVLLGEGEGVAEAVNARRAEIADPAGQASPANALDQILHQIGSLEGKESHG